MTRESMEFDVVVVGAGPAGLAAAIRLKQLARDAKAELSVCVVEKGSEVGAHILSGAVIDPKALDELIPDWRTLGAPLDTPATADSFLFLTKRFAVPLPTPPSMHNQGNFVASLGNLCRWLAAQAEALEVEIFPGFAVTHALFGEDGAVTGVAIGDMGIGRDGKPGPNFAPGVDLMATRVLVAEGARGSLAATLIRRFALDKDSSPQTFGLGVKELWEVDPAKHKPGTVLHTVGWPLDQGTYGGSFLYHLSAHQVAVGFVVGLDYENPHLSPFEEFQRFKTHPKIRPLFEGGRRIAYGARALYEGGLQSQPRLDFPGGLLIGDAAGFVNVPKIKGTHTAMKSGMLAAEAVFGDLTGKGGASYPERVRASWVWRELHEARNIRPSFRLGFVPGLIWSAVDAYVLKGRTPFTFPNRADHLGLKRADACEPIAYPKPDGVVSFDRLSSVFVSNTHHEENQPNHLKLTDEGAAISVNLALYDAPEQRYCPAGVYEIDRGGSQARLVINAGNCLHCKSCDIKDPTGNITWTVPEGGGGPNYPNM